jgi:hypothetical protein
VVATDGRGGGRQPSARLRVGDLAASSWRTTSSSRSFERGDRLARQPPRVHTRSGPRGAACTTASMGFPPIQRPPSS